MLPPGLNIQTVCGLLIMLCMLLTLVSIIPLIDYTLHFTFDTYTLLTFTIFVKSIGQVHEACTKMNTQEFWKTGDCAYWTNAEGGIFNGSMFLFSLAYSFLSRLSSWNTNRISQNVTDGLDM